MLTTDICSSFLLWWISLKTFKTEHKWFVTGLTLKIQALICETHTHLASDQIAPKQFFSLTDWNKVLKKTFGRHSALSSQEGFYFQLNFFPKPLLRVYASGLDLNSLPIWCGNCSIIKKKLPTHIAPSYHAAAGSVGVTAEISLSQGRDY